MRNPCDFHDIIHSYHWEMPNSFSLPNMIPINKSHDQPLTVQPKHECTETQTNCVRDAAARDHICPPSSGTGERKSAACENSAKLNGSSGLPVLLR